MYDKNESEFGTRHLFMGIWLAFAFLVIILGLTWIIQGNQFFLAKVFMPAEENLRRETFEKSHAYNAGMVQELENFQVQYIQATDDQKAGLASIILRRIADFGGDEKLPQHLKDFAAKLRRDHRK